MEYTIERKETNNNAYTVIGKVNSITSSKTNQYTFNDKTPAAGNNYYRVKVVNKNGDKAYTNSITLQSGAFNTTVYPNPVKNVLHVTLSGSKESDYGFELMNMSGQVVYKTKMEKVLQSTFTYHRNKSLVSGVYVLKVTNLSTGNIENYKVVFE